MVIREDSELEKYVLGEKTDIIVPVDIFMPVDGEAVVTTYDCCYAYAEAFEKKYRDNPFSDEAYRFLDASLGKLIDGLGYTRFKKDHKPIVEYMFESDRTVNAELIKDGTRLLTTEDEADGIEALTLHEITPEEDDDFGAVAAYIENGKALACSSVNDFTDDEKPEINVECEPYSRGHGYATSCVALLTSHLIGLGYDVSYKCRETNKASMKIAEKVGYRRVGVRLSYVAYKKQDERI